MSHFLCPKGIWIRPSNLLGLLQSVNNLLKVLLGAAILAGSLGVILAAARAGLLILGTSPNPRHPPSDLMGEALGMAILVALLAAAVTMFSEALVMRDRPGRFGTYKGFVLGSVTAICLGALLGAALAIVQMDSTDGQAITSGSLGTVAGGTVGILGAGAGAVIGSVVKRMVTALAP